VDSASALRGNRDLIDPANRVASPPGIATGGLRQTSSNHGRPGRSAERLKPCIGWASRRIDFRSLFEQNREAEAIAAPGAARPGLAR